MTKPSSWPYQTLGNSKNPPIVFLHGFMGSGADWLSIAEGLAGNYFCLLPDLPGHGHNTDLPFSESLNFDVVVNGFRRWLKQHGLKQIDLVGYSMGGRIALYAATQFPERIKTLVVESANPGLVDTQARRARATADDERAETLLQAGIDAFVEQWYELGLFSSLKQYPNLLEQTKINRKQNDPRWAAKIIGELSPGRQPPLWNQLKTLPMPVLLLAGALDSKYSSLMAKMGEKIPNATFEVIPNAGHNVHLERAEHFVEILADFLVTAPPHVISRP